MYRSATMILNSLLMIGLGLAIELKRHKLNNLIQESNSYSSASIIKLNAQISKLGVKWMKLASCFEIDRLHIARD